MKLNKPEITENQTELESYVANLLMEELSSSEVVQPINEKTPLKHVKSNVSDINQSKRMIHELIPKTDTHVLSEKDKPIESSRPAEKNKPVVEKIIENKNEEPAKEKLAREVSVTKDSLKEKTLRVEEISLENKVELDEICKSKV